MTGTILTAMEKAKNYLSWLLMESLFGYFTVKISRFSDVHLGSHVWSVCMHFSVRYFLLSVAHGCSLNSFDESMPHISQLQMD